MNRHLYIITNSGDPLHRIPNVIADRDNYYAFFTSPEGGAWVEDEISIRDDNFYLEELQGDICSSRERGIPLDYVLIVFCGHGYSNELQQRCFELRPDVSGAADVTLEEIKSVCRGVRTLLITDSCLEFWTPQPAVTRWYSSTNESIRGIGVGYANRCRQLYNQLILATQKDIFVATFAVSLFEAADDNSRGGIYSQNLLDVAREMINYLKSPASGMYDYSPISSIHEETEKRVIKMTEGKQHPEIQMQRSLHQLPFVVVAK